MAKRLSADIVRRNLSSDLLRLSQALQSSSRGTVVNPDVLKSSANAVSRNTRGGAWSYVVAGLILRVQVPQSTRPVSCTGPLTIELDLTFAGNCDNESDDTITELVLEISIKSASGEHICAWHFDRHIEGGNCPLEAHPLYHFQHGGHAMEPHADCLGMSLLLPAPRLAFPPMDAVLAIDFVLSNFAGECWAAMRENSTYLRMLRESQKLLWRPYLRRLADWWECGPQDKEKTIALLPHLA